MKTAAVYAERRTPAEAKRSGEIVPINTGDHRERVRERRDELVAQYTPLVNGIAKAIHQRTPPSIELDDLIQTGMVALLHAATRYRPEAFPGITFGAYAKYVVRGAILDSISGRHWQNAVLQELFDPAAAPADEPFAEPTIDEEIDAGRRTRDLADAMAYLEERDRRLMAAYYREDGNFTTAGAEVGLSRRRAGEVHAEAIGKLRSILHVRP